MWGQAGEGLAWVVGDQECTCCVMQYCAVAMHTAGKCETFFSFFLAHCLSHSLSPLLWPWSGPAKSTLAAWLRCLWTFRFTFCFTGEFLRWKEWLEGVSEMS